MQSRWHLTGKISNGFDAGIHGSQRSTLEKYIPGVFDKRICLHCFTVDIRITFMACIASTEWIRFLMNPAESYWNLLSELFASRVLCRGLPQLNSAYYWSTPLSVYGIISIIYYNRKHSYKAIFSWYTEISLNELFLHILLAFEFTIGKREDF